MDVAIIGERDGGQHILVFHQNSKGAFDPAVDIPVQDITLRGLAIGDVNNDGKDELVVSGISRTATTGSLGRMVVYHQNATNGTLEPSPEVIVSSMDVGDLCVADLNSDGRKDIAVLGSSAPATKGNISIYYQKNDGTLDQEYVYKESFVRVTGNLRAADMNSDGRNDLVFQSGDSEVSVVRQLAGGTLSAIPDPYTVPTDNSSFAGIFAVGDADGDGKNDVVAVSSGTTGFFYIFLQNGAGKLDPPFRINLLQRSPDAIELADINGDGLNDIVGSLADYVVVYYQGADRRFSASDFKSFAVQASGAGNPASPPALATGDVTGDGLRDVLVTGMNEGLFVLPGMRQVSTGTGGSISGKVTAGGAPLTGVTVSLSGATSKTTTTNATGDYTFTLTGNGNYKVTPSKVNYAFTPTNRVVTVNGLDVMGQDFTGTTYSISGKVTAGGVPLSGVFMSLSGATSKTTTTNAIGDYTFTIVGNGSYTVTPSRAGYTFSPANRSVAVNGADVTGQDFSGTTYSISGKVTAGGAPLSGVSMSLSGTTNKVATTDANGDYTFSIVGNGSYTVTPSKTGYTFTPVNRSVTVNGADVTGQDFTGTTYSISGKVTAAGAPLSGVSMSLSGTTNKVATTDANGDYTFTIVGNGSYTVTPSRAGYTFTPVNRSVTVNGADVAGQDFAGTTYSISGTVTAGGVALSGATVSLSGTTNKVATTDASGNYTFTIVGNGSYTVTPSRAGYTFSPANRSVTVSGADVTGQDFAGN
jgi:inhibitor of cysteine peptidase